MSRGGTLCRRCQVTGFSVGTLFQHAPLSVCTTFMVAAPYGGCKNSIKGIFAGDKTIKNKVVFHSTAFEMPACV